MLKLASRVRGPESETSQRKGGDGGASGNASTRLQGLLIKIKWKRLDQATRIIAQNQIGGALSEQAELTASEQEAQGQSQSIAPRPSL